MHVFYVSIALVCLASVLMINLIPCVYYLQVILTSLLKVYVKGGLFDKARELLNDLEALGHAQNEVHIVQLSFTHPVHNKDSQPFLRNLQCS